MFRQIDPKAIKENTIGMISDEWMLITAGDMDKYNMMTASWGFVGEMWGCHSVVAAVRPQRYTMEFIEKNDLFTLSFYGDRRDIHKVCGNMSGREADKTTLTGLHPVELSGAIAFCEARLVLVCRKRYCKQLDSAAFTAGEAEKLYPSGDFHNMIIGEIVAAYEQ